MERKAAVAANKIYTYFYSLPYDQKCAELETVLKALRAISHYFSQAQHFKLQDFLHNADVYRKVG